MSAPSKMMRPASGATSPASWPISVVLPAPFGPMIACNSPSGMSSVTLSVAMTPPKRLLRPSICRSASATVGPRQQAVDPAAGEQHDRQQHRTQHDLPIFRRAQRRLAEQRKAEPSRSASGNVSSSTSSATAPMVGPKTEPMPPSTTMTMRSPERVQCIIAGLMKLVKLASSAPASPHIAPAMTKQTRR